MWSNQQNKMSRLFWKNAMKKLLSLIILLPIRLAIRLITHQLHYWLAEPFMVIVIKIMKSIRFLFMTSILLTITGTSFWAYHNPVEAKDFIFSYLPRITIEMPE
jgi:hypothetical protein